MIIEVLAPQYPVRELPEWRQQRQFPFFVTSLPGLPQNMAAVYFVLMTALSLVFHIPINITAKKVGKQQLVLTAFFFAGTYLYTTFLGNGSI